MRSGLDNKEIASVVLGCTHYPLIMKEIRRVWGANVKIIDGNRGTARNVKRILENSHLLAEPGKTNGEIQFFTFGDRETVIPLFKQSLNFMMR